MKKLLATFALTVAVAGVSYGQGTVVFQNYDTSVTPALVEQVFDTDGTTGLTGAGYTAELWAGTSGQALSLVTTTDFSTTLPGIFNSKGVAIPGVAGGADADIQIRVFDNSSGATYDAATIRNQSDVFTVTLADASSPNLVYLVPGMTSFNLAVVPEPSVILLGLAGAGLLWFRRKK